MNRGAAFYRNVARLALPILLQNLCTTLLGLIDTFMVGALGEAPLAAVLVANIPVFVIQLVIFGLQSGSSVLISQFWGKGDTESINRVIGLGCYVAGAISLAFASVMFFLPEQLMGLLTDNQALVPLAAQYARIVGFSYIFNSLTGVYVGAHRSMENPKLGMIIFGASMLTNAFLNWVFIFGNLGAPALGVVGAAVATLSARVLEFVIMFSYALTNHRFRLKPAVLFRPGRALLAKFLHYSGPVVLNETLWGLGTALYPTIMGYMDGSTEILAAYAISGNIEKVCTVIVFAIAGTAAVIIGREIGAGRLDTVYDTGRTLNTLSFLAGLTVGVLLILGTLYFISPVVYPNFGLSREAQDIATMMLLVTFSFLSVRSFNTTNIVGVLRGGGDVRAATLNDVLPLWCFALPLSAFFGLVLKLDIFWVYLSISLENVVKFFIGLWRFRSGAWIHDVTQVSYQKNDPS